MAVRSDRLPLANVPIAAGHIIYIMSAYALFEQPTGPSSAKKLAADTAAPHKSTAKLGHALPE